MKRFLNISLLGLAVAVVIGTVSMWVYDWLYAAEPVMSVGVSSDGRYAVTAHRDNRLHLWDLKERDRTTVADNANIYSAYFVPGAESYLWQDLEGTVHLTDVEGRIQESFKVPIDTYGHVMTSDLKDYYFSDIGWGIHHRDPEGNIETLKEPDGKAFLGYGTLLNLDIPRDERFILSVGDGLREYATHESYEFQSQEDKGYQGLNGLTLWDREESRPVARFGGNSAKTHASISPDGRWVVSGDENNLGFFWKIEEPEERHRMASYTGGIYQDDTPHKPGDPRNWDDSELIEAPSGLSGNVIALAFVSDDHFLRFGNNSHKAALFKAGNPWPQKYFDLGKSPGPVTYGSQYSRNTAIATSPEAGVLVMGHQSGGGISVYQFDEKALELERVWVAR